MLEKEKLKRIIAILVALGIFVGGNLALNRYRDSCYQKADDALKQNDSITAAEQFYRLKNFKDSAFRAKELYYDIAEEFIEEENYTDAQFVINKYSSDPSFTLLKDIVNLRSNEAWRNEVYFEAVEQMRSGKVDDAIIGFDKVGDYKAAKSFSALLTELLPYQYVEWNNGSMDIRIVGNQVECRFSIGQYELSETIEKKEGNKFYSYAGGRYFYIKDDRLYFYSPYNKKTEIFTKGIATRSEPITSSPTLPKIGMTAEEVKKTIWGSPNEINKTTTKYGVDEQWVYGLGRYVYLEDGIVTAIQE